MVFLWFSYGFHTCSYGPETAPGPQPRLRGPLARGHSVAHVARDAAGGAGESATAAALLAAQQQKNKIHNYCL